MHAPRLGHVACMTASTTTSLAVLGGDLSGRSLRLFSSLRTRRRQLAARACDIFSQPYTPSPVSPYLCSFAAVSLNTLRCRLPQIKARAAGRTYISHWRAAGLAVHSSRSRCRLARLLAAVWQILRCLRLCLRAARAVALLLPVLALYGADELLRWGRGGDNKDDDEFRVWHSGLVSAVAHCGPTAIKFGQWASTRRDLFSPELCHALSRLQRAAQQHDWWHTQDVLAKHLGSEWWKTCSLDPTPVGSGCVAQVYKGYLHVNTSRSGGTDIGKSRVPVAVKVLHPHIREAVSDDLSVLHFVARVVEWLIPSTHYLNLAGCVDEFGTCLMDQVDLRVEARNLAMFNLKFTGCPAVKFARPLYPYIANDLLIETFEDGIPISSFIPGAQHEDGRLPTWAGAHAEPDKAMHSCRKQIASAGLHAMLKMIFEDNFVHADLHPGNISIQMPESPPTARVWSFSLAGLSDAWSVTRSVVSGSGTCTVRPAEPTLIIYDCGIVSRLSSDARAHFRDVFTAVVLDKGERVAELFLLHSTESDCPDVVAFKLQMAKLVHRFRGDSLTLGKVRVSQLLSDVFGLLSRNRIRLEKDFVNIIVAIAVLEGLGRSLDPDVDLLKAARRYLLP